MSQKIAVHKGNEEFPNALWWRPFFDWQKQVNDAFATISPTLASPALYGPGENPFAAAQRNLNRVFGEMFNNRQMLTPWLLGRRPEPYIDIIENDDRFLVKADMPGVEAQGIDVSVSRNALIISGEKSADKAANGGTYLRRECCSGRFSRTVALPEGADMSNAQASFEPHGSVLTVEIPKNGKMEQKMRRLKIAEGEKGRIAGYPEGREKKTA